MKKQIMPNIMGRSPSQILATGEQVEVINLEAVEEVQEVLHTEVEVAIMDNQVILTTVLHVVNQGIMLQIVKRITKAIQSRNVITVIKSVILNKSVVHSNVNSMRRKTKYTMHTAFNKNDQEDSTKESDNKQVWV